MSQCLSRFVSRCLRKLWLDFREISSSSEWMKTPMMATERALLKIFYETRSMVIVQMKNWCAPSVLSTSTMMKFLNAYSFTPYVIYRVCLGIVLLGIAYT